MQLLGFARGLMISYPPIPYQKHIFKVNDPRKEQHFFFGREGHPKKSNFSKTTILIVMTTLPAPKKGQGTENNPHAIQLNADKATYAQAYMSCAERPQKSWTKI